MCLSNLVSYVCIIDWFNLYAQFQWKMNSCKLCFPVINQWIWWNIACLSKHLPLPGLRANDVIFLPWILMPTSCMMILNLMLKIQKRTNNVISYLQKRKSFLRVNKTAVLFKLLLFGSAAVVCVARLFWFCRLQDFLCQLFCCGSASRFGYCLLDWFLACFACGFAPSLFISVLQ